jgi:hypothetical protein
MNLQRKPHAAILHPFLLAAFPVLNLYSYNIRSTAVSEIALPLAMSLAATLLVLLSARLFSRNWHKAAVITSALLILFFSFGHTRKICQACTPAGRPASIDLILVITWALMLFAGAVALIRFRGSFLGGTKILNVAAAVLMAVPLAKIGLYVVKNRAMIFDPIPPLSPILAKTDAAPLLEGRYPDIYYIILDAYARKDILREIYQYDNSAFLDALARRGFYVASKSCSNYAQTYLSISSAFNLAYHDELARRSGPQSNYIMPLRRLIHHNRMFDFLRSHGHRITTFSTGAPITELHECDDYLGPAAAMPGFVEELLRNTPVPVLRRAMRLPSDQRRRILYALNQLGRLCPVDQPRFVFAHVLAPHEIFIFDANGDPIDPDGRNRLNANDGSAAALYIRDYRNQLTFINTQVLQAVDRILANAKTPPVIILCSDHGPAAHTDWDRPDPAAMRERLSILTACYFPDRDYSGFYDTVTPVNVVRILLTHYFHAALDPLPDRSFFSSIPFPYRMIDATEILNPVVGQSK